MATKLNKRLLRKVRNRIAKIPESYSQAHYRKSSPVAPCGTQACLAGETIICNAPTVKDGVKRLLRSKNVPLRARVLLGLDDDTASAMFGFNPVEFGNANGQPWGWPEPFKSQFGKATTTKARAKVAVAYLDECLKRGKVTW